MTCIGLKTIILPTFIFLESYQSSKDGVSKQVYAGKLYCICEFAVQAIIRLGNAAQQFGYYPLNEPGLKRTRVLRCLVRTG